jgi:hypothetical protein
VEVASHLALVGGYTPFDITFANGRFVAVGFGLGWSDDGQEWQPGTILE